jgi:hypothetical protein
MLRRGIISLGLALAADAAFAQGNIFDQGKDLLRQQTGPALRAARTRLA